VELIGIALNAACTNLNPDGTRRHIRRAIDAGLFISLIPFFAFRNVSRELPPGQLYALLFGRAEKTTDG